MDALFFDEYQHMRACGLTQYFVRDDVDDVAPLPPGWDAVSDLANELGVVTVFYRIGDGRVAVTSRLHWTKFADSPAEATQIIREFGPRRRPNWLD